ncbi:MAG: leucine-rich repeat domain-containing protein [Clostridiales bacterium]|nr:leucine-rich repeat domain-containing protein [Clostridiales bacterium]
MKKINLKRLSQIPARTKKHAAPKSIKTNARLLSLCLSLVALMTCVSVTFAWFGSTYENLNTVIEMGDFSANITVYSADGSVVAAQSASNGETVDFDNSNMMSGWSCGDASCYYVYIDNTGDIDIKTYFSIASGFYAAGSTESMDGMTEHFSYYLKEITSDALKKGGLVNFMAADELSSAESIYTQGKAFAAQNQEDAGVVEAGESGMFALYFCCYDLPDEYISDSYSFIFDTSIITTQAGAPEIEETVAQTTEITESTLGTLATAASKTDKQTKEQAATEATDVEETTSASSSASVTHTTAATVVSQQKSEWEWEYNDSSEKTVCLTAYNGSKTEVTVPSIADGAIVTALGENLFADSKVESVVVPACVKSFGGSTFSVSTLKSLKFQTKTSVLDKVYTSPYTSDSKAIYTSDKTALVRCLPQNIGESFNVPADATAIYDNALSGCSKLESISLYNVGAVSTLTFEGCTIKDYYLYGYSVLTATGSNVFGSKKTVTIHVVPDMKEDYASALIASGYTVVDDIEKNIYETAVSVEADGIKYVIIESGSQYNGVKYSLDGCKKIAVAVGYTSIPDNSTVVIPEKIAYKKAEYSVAAIADNAFAGCTELEELVLPNHKVTYTAASFAGCTNLGLIQFDDVIPYNADADEVAALNSKDDEKTTVSDDNETEPAE